MFQLQVTIIRQIFQYTDMTCKQYGIPYCKHWKWTGISAWWWLLV